MLNVLRGLNSNYDHLRTWITLPFPTSLHLRPHPRGAHPGLSRARLDLVLHLLQGTRGYSTDVFRLAFGLGGVVVLVGAVGTAQLRL